MRTRLAGHVETDAFRFGDESHTVGAADVDDVQFAARLACQVERQSDRFEFHRDRARREVIAHARAVGILWMIDLRMDGHVAASAFGKSSMPLPDMNAFNPIAPQSRIASMASSFPGTSPPHSAKSTCDFCSATARFAANDSASHTGGVELSGMSK